MGRCCGLHVALLCGEHASDLRHRKRIKDRKTVLLTCSGVDISLPTSVNAKLN